MYLLQNRLNATYTDAELELTDTNLRCAVTEYSRWVEKALGINDLKDRLSAGISVTVFDFRPDRLDVKWLKQFLGGGFLVREGDSRRWLVSLIDPASIWSVVEAIDGRAIHKQWCEARSLRT